MKLKWVISFFFLMLILSSCYTIKIANKHGVPIPDPENNTRDFFYGMQIEKLDTTVNLNLIQGEVMTLEDCPDGSFYALEYKATFGGVLLNMITFGKKKKIKVRYVCSKPKN